MSINSIERVLWELTEDPQKVAAFIDSPDSFLLDYQVTKQDALMIKDKNVRLMSDRGVSPMLLMLFWMSVSGGPATMGEYMQRINTPVA